MVINDLLIVKPMPSYTGVISYMEFTLGTEKGGVGEDTMIQSPFMLGEMTEARANYTGATVVETVKKDGKVDWMHGKFGAFGKLAADEPVRFHEGYVQKAGEELLVKVDEVVEGDKVSYVYDNQIVPQEKLPTLVGRMKAIPVTAKARRIAVQYSQFAAYQAKNDYGIDFEKTIEEQAQAELSYEIDSEAVYMIKEAADKGTAAHNFEDKAPVVTWVDEELDTISYSMKAEGFLRAIMKAKNAVYMRTKRWNPNWMLVSPEVLPILAFVPGAKGQEQAASAGAYVWGNVAGMKVIVHPFLAGNDAGFGEDVKGVCYLGVLGNDGHTAVGYYAPYLPIIPTNLLTFADGLVSKGFSTMYAMGILNTALLAKIEVKAGNDAAMIEVFEKNSEN